MRTNQQRSRAKVRRGQLEGKTVPESLSLLDEVCGVAARCPEVRRDPAAREALGKLRETVTRSARSLARRRALAEALVAAIRTLRFDAGEARLWFDTFQTAVDGLAGGDARVIHRAGLPARYAKMPPGMPRQVARLCGAPGRSSGAAGVSWEGVPGARGYAVEVNFTPEKPKGWVPFAVCGARARRSVVKGAAPGKRVLVRVAALGARGERSEWTTVGVKAK